MFNNVIDRTIGGATIKTIRSAVIGHMRQMEPGDLVMVEGGGNALFEMV